MSRCFLRNFGVQGVRNPWNVLLFLFSEISIYHVFGIIIDCMCLFLFFYGQQFIILYHIFVKITSAATLVSFFVSKSYIYEEIAKLDNGTVLFCSEWLPLF